MIDVGLLPKWIGGCKEMSTLGELHNMGIPYPKFAIGPQLVIQDMEESEFVNASNSQIVPRRMESKRKQWLICIQIFFHLEVKHPQQFTSIILVIPYSDGTIQMAAGSNQRSLLADIHTRDGEIVKSFIEVFEDDLFVCEIIEQVGDLRNELVYVEGCDVVVGEGDGDKVLF